MERARLNLNIAKTRLEKLRRVAKQRKYSMTVLVEMWIDSLEETK